MKLFIYFQITPLYFLFFLFLTPKTHFLDFRFFPKKTLKPESTKFTLQTFFAGPVVWNTPGPVSKLPGKKPTP